MAEGSTSASRTGSARLLPSLCSTICGGSIGASSAHWRGASTRVAVAASILISARNTRTDSAVPPVNSATIRPARPRPTGSDLTPMTVRPSTSDSGCPGGVTVSRCHRPKVGRRSCRSAARSASVVAPMRTVRTKMSPTGDASRQVTCPVSHSISTGPPSGLRQSANSHRTRARERQTAPTGKSVSSGPWPATYPFPCSVAQPAPPARTTARFSTAASTAGPRTASRAAGSSSTP